MMLPNAERAVVTLSRLVNYTLNPIHARGRHKARAFRRRLRLTQQNAEYLRQALLQAARQQPAVLGERDQHGQRYAVDFTMISPRGKPVRVHSAWIIRPDEDFPRYLSAYVKS